MIPFERRQRIVSLLQEQPGSRVSKLARALRVSDGTIRSDLRALAAEGQLTRVRGGAVLKDSLPFVSPAFAARLQVNAAAKQRIARHAAQLVEDGDSILLDASTTAFSLVPYLKSHRNLTVVTNGIEAGLALAQNPAHAVILVGGIIRPEGTSVVGPLGEKILEDLHVKIAFVSCSGFSVEAGLTEVDIHEVQLKKQMIRCAERVIALIDSSKFGRVDLTSFASLEHISCILSDRGLAPRFIDQLRQVGTPLTICDERLASSVAPRGENVASPALGRSTMPGGKPATPAPYRQHTQGVGSDDIQPHSVSAFSGTTEGG